MLGEDLEVVLVLTRVSDGYGQTKSLLKGPEVSLTCLILST